MIFAGLRNEALFLTVNGLVGHSEEITNRFFPVLKLLKYTLHIAQIALNIRWKTQQMRVTVFKTLFSVSIVIIVDSNVVLDKALT